MQGFEVTYNEGVESYEKAVGQGDEELVLLGFPPAQRPADHGQPLERPQMPVKISELSLAELTDHMALLTGWYSYALEVLPTVEGERDAAKTAREFAWSRIRASHEGRVADKDDATRCDSRYIKTSLRYEVCAYKYRRVKAICDGLYREIETVSRAITGKEQEQRATGIGLMAAQRGYRNGQGPAPRKMPFVRKTPMLKALPPREAEDE